MSISMIAAINKNNCIGKDGQLLYKISKDLKRFKNLTKGNTVLMGRNTYEEIGKPLPDRRNIILSKNIDFKLNNPELEIVSDYNEIIKEFKDSEDELFIIGGQVVYEELKSYADTVYITLIEDDTVGDRFFDYDYVVDNFKLYDSILAYDGEYYFDFLTYKK